MRRLIRASVAARFALALAVALAGAPMVEAQFANVQERQLGERVLSLGSWGADVFYLQQHLARAGYELTIDGHYGRDTERVVTAFQLSQGLEPDGVAGPSTIAALTSIQTTFVYVVQPGDSLWAIARAFETTMEELIRLNNLPDGPILIGQRLVIPHIPTYQVRAGDTLSAIARRFGTTVRAIAALNGITDPDRIRVGMHLRLPRGSEPTIPGL